MSRLARTDQKFFVLDIVQPMAMQTRVGGVDLQLEGSELGGFVLLSIELVQVRLEAIGEE